MKFSGHETRQKSWSRRSVDLDSPNQQNALNVTLFIVNKHLATICGRVDFWGMGLLKRRMNRICVYKGESLGCAVDFHQVCCGLLSR